jgi:hypothetical protein
MISSTIVSEYRGSQFDEENPVVSVLKLRIGIPDAESFYFSQIIATTVPLRTEAHSLSFFNQFNSIRA